MVTRSASCLAEDTILIFVFVSKITLQSLEDQMDADSWLMLGITAGVSASNWTAELFIDNLTSEEAEISRSFVFDRERVTYARPRTAGLRVSYDF